MQAVSEKVRKASQRAYQGLVSYKVTISCSATSVFLPLRFLFSAHEPGQNAGWDVERPSFVWAKTNRFSRFKFWLIRPFTAANRCTARVKTGAQQQMMLHLYRHRHHQSSFCALKSELAYRVTAFTINPTWAPSRDSQQHRVIPLGLPEMNPFTEQKVDPPGGGVGGSNVFSLGLDY